MKFLLEFLGAILGVLGSAITFHIPSKALFGSVIAGILGWEVKVLLIQCGVVPVYATFLGALTLSICCGALAVALRMPSTVFLVPSILPLVPGTATYDSMMYLINGNHDMATAEGMKAMLIASGIAIGILMGSAISRSIINPNLHNLRETIKQDFDISLDSLGEDESSLPSKSISARIKGKCKSRHSRKRGREAKHEI
ncbi:threonine/serine exporter family protein [bacterium]|nr:threonine/serine exporter family protein [bacterium]